MNSSEKCIIVAKSDESGGKWGKVGKMGNSGKKW